MNRKRITIILLVFVLLIAGGIFLWGQRTDTRGNESGSIIDNVTQDKGIDENDVKQNDEQEENELPIISPSSDSQGESKNESKNETTGADVSDKTESNSTSDYSNNTDNSEEENSEDISEDTSELDDNLDMELPFVPAT